MERLYLSASYLKTFHYLFFSFAVFSLTAGIMFFDFARFESLNFFGLGLFYCLASLLAAYYFYRNYREIVEPIRVIRLYALPYIILVFWTILSLTAVVLVTPSILGLVYSFLFINYYMFFVVLIGLAAGRFRFISRFFEVYNFFILGRAKKIARKYALTIYTAHYKIGSDPKLDAILDEIWVHRSYPIPYIRKFETTLCEKHVIEINRILEKLKAHADEKNKTTIESLERMKGAYLKKIREIEQKED
jgi:hypothetical protein